MIYIYSISTQEEPGNIRYVGKTKEAPKRRLKRHLSAHYLNGNYYKVNWLKSELKKSHTPIIEIIDIVNEDEWEFWECYWIAQFKAWGFNLTNGTIGGDGIKLTKEIIEKRNESNVNRNNFRIQERMKKFNIRKENDLWLAERTCDCGRVISYRYKSRAIILNILGRVDKENRGCNFCKVSGEKNYFFGKKLNDGKLKQKRYGKKIIQTDLSGKKISEFKSIREASEKTGIDRKSISNCAKGIKSYNTAGGYKFKIK